MKEPKFKEIHTRSARLTIERHDLTKIIRAEALRVCGLSDSQAVTVEIRLEDATTGNPPYKVGTQAVVTVVEDQMLLDHPKDDWTGEENEG